MKTVAMLLTNPFRPDPRVLKEARALVKAGYEVNVLAWDRGEGLPPVEDIEGIHIERVSIPSGYDSFISQIINLPRFWWRAFRWLIANDWDIVHCHDLDTLPIGLVAAWAKVEKPVIFDSHELYVYMVEKSTPKPVLKLISKLERMMVKRAEAVITVNARLDQYFQERKAKQVVQVMNCEDPRQVSEDSILKVKKELCIKDEFVVSYVGSLNPGRKVVELAEWGAKLGKGYRMVLAGGGTDQTIVQTIADHHTSIDYLGYIHPDKALEITAASDAVVAIFDTSDRNNLVITPIKMFDAMSMGVPVIISKGMEGGTIIEETGAGIAIDTDEESFRAALERLRNDPQLAQSLGDKGRDAVDQQYNWKEMSRRLLDTYERLLSKNSFK